ncbi:MAG: hypothetical protein KC636_17650 [Myxococcales bacterium]|nr:hypothetical protein [Myxococcales bacterium]
MVSVDIVTSVVASVVGSLPAVVSGVDVVVAVVVDGSLASVAVASVVVVSVSEGAAPPQAARSDRNAMVRATRDILSN